MDKNEKLLRELRNHYGTIYHWHKKNGVNEFKSRYEQEISPDDEWFNEYLHYVDRMPSPENASLESIGAVATAVLQGCLEWSYCKKADSELSLSEVAKYILKTIEHFDKYEEDSQNLEKLKNIRNIGEGSGLPTVVKIRIAEGNNRRDYIQYAAMAYHDASPPHGVENLGGMVALADTNLEHEQKHKGCIDSEYPEVFTFRNARAMNLAEDLQRESLVSFVKTGAILIESVKIGTGE